MIKGLAEGHNEYSASGESVKLANLRSQVYHLLSHSALCVDEYSNNQIKK